MIHLQFCRTKRFTSRNESIYGISGNCSGGLISAHAYLRTQATLAY